MKRFGIFGGTFNPPHIAHSILANDVREQMHLEKIIFIPSAVPPLKEGETVLEIQHRFAMTKLAFGNDKYFEVSDIEINNSNEKSFTVNTLLKLREKYKDDFVKLYLILGVDGLIDFPKWKSPDKIFALSDVLIMNRPGYLVQDVLPEFSQKVKFLSVPMLEVSSTMIRDYVYNNKSIKYLVSPEVEEYIKSNNLYKK